MASIAAQPFPFSFDRRSIALIVIETVFLGVFVVAGLHLLG